MLRIPTRLELSLEDLAYRTIGCCIAVHGELGPGLMERAYLRAAQYELDSAQIPFECEKAYPIFYRGKPVCLHRLDLVVAGQMVLELKAVDCLLPVHQAQVLSYLRASRLRLGLLINFNVPLLPQSIKRIVL